MPAESIELSGLFEPYEPDASTSQYLETHMFEKLEALNVEIVGILLDVVPDSWDAIGYQVEKRGDRYPMFIFSPEGKKDVIPAPESLYEVVFKIADAYLGEKKMWSKLVYTVTYLEDVDKWNYVVDYTY